MEPTNKLHLAKLIQSCTLSRQNRRACRHYVLHVPEHEISLPWPLHWAVCLDDVLVVVVVDLVGLGALVVRVISHVPSFSVYEINSSLTQKVQPVFVGS